MISDFNAQYFGGNKNCVNAKSEILLNHSNPRTSQDMDGALHTDFANFYTI